MSETCSRSSPESAGSVRGSPSRYFPAELSSIKGVGKKTAEKICIELKDKVDAIAALAATKRAGGKGADSAAPVLHDAILALTALGFSAETANKMVGESIAANPDAKDTETIVRLALSGSRK